MPVESPGSLPRSRVEFPTFWKCTKYQLLYRFLPIHFLNNTVKDKGLLMKLTIEEILDFVWKHSQNGLDEKLKQRVIPKPTHSLDIAVYLNLYFSK